MHLRPLHALPNTKVTLFGIPHHPLITYPIAGLSSAVIAASGYVPIYTIFAPALAPSGKLVRRIDKHYTGLSKMYRSDDEH
jgi:hypothetical protein